MTGWTVSATTPENWASESGKDDALFHGRDWMAFLERGFGCESIYAAHPESGEALGISVFRAGPFRIGYVGFPVGGTAGYGVVRNDAIKNLRNALAGFGPVALRIPCSAFDGSTALDFPSIATPETAIVDLQSWSQGMVSKNRRRDIKRALRSGLQISDADEPADGERLYQLYRQTIERHSGALRYTAKYFQELIGLGKLDARLRVLTARIDGALVGFNVVARHGPAGCYLHGAIDWESRMHRPAALLMCQAIEWAQAEGCDVFNLLPSPPGQRSLIRYKEQWGGETREHRTYTMPIRPMYRVFRLAEQVYRVFR